jgi:hypothetical protein
VIVKPSNRPTRCAAFETSYDSPSEVTLFSLQIHPERLLPFSALDPSGFLLIETEDLAIRLANRGINRYPISRSSSQDQS